MSIAGSYRNINGVLALRRRRRISRNRRSVQQAVWVIEAADEIVNVAITILVDSRYPGTPSVTPQIGTRNFSIVCGPFEGEQQRLLRESEEDELLSVDVDIAVQEGAYVVSLLQLSRRVSKEEQGWKPRKGGGKGEGRKAAGRIRRAEAVEQRGEEVASDAGKREPSEVEGRPRTGKGGRAKAANRKRPSTKER